MRVSVGLPTCMEGLMYPVPFASAKDVIRVALAAEKLGYHSVWGNDHLSTPDYVRTSYSTPPNFWDVLIALMAVASRTEKIKIGTGVLVPALRNQIVVLAKQIATLDHFSDGRLIVGLGIGAYREEFESLYPGIQVHRGELLEEFIQSLSVLFNERSPSWKGKYYQFENVEMYPKPLQEPLPIYIGGNDKNASRRAALYAQGWMPAAMPLSRLKRRISKFREQVEELGRDFRTIDIAAQYQVYIDKTYEKAVGRWKTSQMYKHKISLHNSTHKDHVEADHVRENLIGTPEIVLEKVLKLKDAGVKHLCGLYFCADDVSELVDQMHKFAVEIVPNLDN